MKKRKLLAIFVVLMMCMGALAGCGGGDAGGDEPAGGNDNSGGGGDDNGVHEIYSYLPDTALSGFMNPDDLPDRTNIEKALPFEPADPDNVVIGWTEITQSDAWFVAVYDAARAKAAEYGYTLLFDVAEHDLQAQSAHIDSYIARGVDIIVVDPTDVVGVAEPIRRAVEAGIPVIGFGSEIFGAPVITTITGNTFENGFVNGEYAGGEYFDPYEEIVSSVVLGVFGNSTAESRVNGMLSGFIYGRAQARGDDISKEDATLIATKLFKDLVRTGRFESAEYNFRCGHVGEGLWTDQGGLENTENAITSIGDSLNLVFAENDFQGAGAAVALRNYNLTDSVKILSPGNGGREFFQLIQDGIMVSNGSHSATQYAEATMKMIYELANGTNTWDENNLPGLTASDPLCINLDNWEDYWDPDTSNPFHKVDEIKVLTVPELRQAIRDGTYGK